MSCRFIVITALLFLLLKLCLEIPVSYRLGVVDSLLILTADPEHYLMCFFLIMVAGVIA